MCFGDAGRGGAWRRCSPRLHRRRRLGALLAAVDSGRVPGPTCMRAKEPPLCDSSPARAEGERPLLMVDIDGVISLFGVRAAGEGRNRRPTRARVQGIFRAIDGIPTSSPRRPPHIRRASPSYDLVRCSGWEEKAGSTAASARPARRAAVPALQRRARRLRGTLDRRALEARRDRPYAGGRALAWSTTPSTASCHAWAERRPAPTLLVQTEPTRATALEARLLAEWAPRRAGAPG